MSACARDPSPHPSQYPLGELLQYEVSQEGDTHLSRDELEKSADSSLNVIEEWNEGNKQQHRQDVGQME